MNARKKKGKSRSRSKSTVSDIVENRDEYFGGGIEKYSVKISKLMGRYMVANVDLRPGEVILSELPIVVGPCTGCKVQCLGCYKNLEERTFTKCKQCGWPLCSQKCKGIGSIFGHTETECFILKQTNSARFLNYKNVSTIRTHLHAIAPLRCLLLKTTSPDQYNLILNMEHHNPLRQNIPEVWNTNQINVVDRIIKDWGLKEYSEEEIHTVCGILEVNCFEIGHDVNVRGLYPKAFLMAHDCVPNTNHNDEENYELTVRASTKIFQGQAITLSYAYTLQSTLKRREHLLNNKFFECFCKRCSDPTELGSYSSALLCPKCTTGIVLCDNPLHAESTWSCTELSKKCPGYTITAKSMKLLLDRITEEVDGIDCNDVATMEYFLSKYRNVLHPKHYINFGIKVSLSQLYGKTKGFLIQELNEDQLERKIEICREVLEVLDVIEPGFTRIRGVTLYELHAPLMILFTRQAAEKNLSKSEFKRRLREIFNYLKEASVILQFEPKSSAEGKMGQAAREALKQVEEWQKIIGKF
ncbi:unnamed protein product [Phyllotreta striolata]|uniref:SET domain-containing protein n=1 Tax=Phyllotreta striolata TaxID=444603 RepID=A0A9N9TTP5_PHYSR|nr:unnamed protein product [Phyllotreta striolata]